MGTFSPADPLGTDFRDAIGARLAGFIEWKRTEAAGIGAELGPMLDLAAAFTEGGKRFRPGCCYWGAAAVAGQPDDPAPLLGAAASLDLLHVSALAHDDVMDASDTRRGVPAAHRQFEALHAGSGWLGSSEAFGRAGAILLGDLLLMWSAELFAGAGLEPDAQRRAEPLLDAVRTEVTLGQYLDVLAQHQPLPTGAGTTEAMLAQVYRVVEYKTSRYTIVRPVQIGAAIAGATGAQLDALAAYGSPLGRAFQFRDDLLGVFGDSAVTGKPAGDDLREGKRTVLVAYALAHAEPNAAVWLADLLGRPDLDESDIDDLRGIIADSGAADAAEREIAQGYEAALAALEGAGFTDEGRTALHRIADLAVRRDS